MNDNPKTNPVIEILKTLRPGTYIQVGEDHITVGDPVPEGTAVQHECWRCCFGSHSMGHTSCQFGDRHPCEKLTEGVIRPFIRLSPSPFIIQCNLYDLPKF